MKKIKIINLGETPLDVVENEIIKNENLEIIGEKDNYENLRIDFQNTDAIFIVLNTNLENERNIALKVIEDAERSNFIGIFDIGNGDAELFDSKINFITNCETVEEIKIGLNGIVSSLINEGLVNIDLDDLKVLFEKTSKVSFISEVGELKNIETFLENLKLKLETLQKNKDDRVFINITGGPEISLDQIKDTVEVTSNILEEATIIWCCLLNPEYEEGIKVTVYSM
ncbi:hypothetical protein [Leptotrichia wadei]|uniref:Cell division protein FtsZ C-terminal domain-containing protein n=1 Tax=Leptotrichia wadei (strain F0279) TaxID=888055 RepID=U2R8Q1_LEPWF|nr:hypothetical protein [Leptotrichia wadei]ERK49963.1 hypothetical protein HMPREF9015_01227 [Leptotrichia wadei F0279]